MGKYDKMTNNLDNETLKAKSSRMKIQNTLGMIDDLLELTRSILKECDKDPDKKFIDRRQFKYFIRGTWLYRKPQLLDVLATTPIIKIFLIKISLELSSLPGDILAPMEKLTTLKKTKKKNISQTSSLDLLSDRNELTP